MGKAVFIAESGQSAENGLSQRVRALGFDLSTTQVPDHVKQLLDGKLHPDVFVFNACPAEEFSDTLRLIRANAHTAHVPVLAVVDEGSDQDRLSAGAQGCVTLPLSQEALRDALLAVIPKVQAVTMAPADIINAPERLADLDESELLDSPPTAELDRLTRLAGRLTGSSACLVSLVDRDRQFFKSQVGLEPPLSEQRQTRLSHSFCQWVVSSGVPLVIDNAHEHPVLKNNLAVKDMSVAAYAGVPLLGRRRKPIGSFCIVDTAPRHWEEHNVELLKDLGAAIEAIAISRHAAEHQTGVPQSWPPQWVRLIGEGVLGASRVLRRYGERLQAQDRLDLMDVIEQQTALLLQERAPA